MIQAQLRKEQQLNIMGERTALLAWKKTKGKEVTLLLFIMAQKRVRKLVVVLLCNILQDNTRGTQLLKNYIKTLTD